MEYIQVFMIRLDLEDIPQFSLPEGFFMRKFIDGGRATWVKVQQRSEIYEKITFRTFDDNFGQDLPGMLKRSYFLVSPAGEDIGTITAWYDKSYAKKRWGRIHWVTIVPEFRGMGLCKPMLTFAMNRLRELGHRRAILATQTPRIAAVKCYLDFGFVPDMRAADAKRGWSLIRKKLTHPVLKRVLQS